MKVFATISPSSLPSASDPSIVANSAPLVSVPVPSPRLENTVNDNPMMLSKLSVGGGDCQHQHHHPSRHHHQCSQEAPAIDEIPPATNPHPVDDTIRAHRPQPLAVIEEDVDEEREGRTQRQLHVLVVDDALTIMRVTKMCLEREGHRVEQAQNGLIALNKMRETVFDVVLMDIQMPEMGGIEATQLLRVFEGQEGRLVARGGRKQLIIGMSANGDAETRRQAIDSGMDAFIPKPFSMFRMMKVFVEVSIPPSPSSCDDVGAVEPVADRDGGNNDTGVRSPWRSTTSDGSLSSPYSVSASLSKESGTFFVV